MSFLISKIAWVFTSPGNLFVLVFLVAGLVAVLGNVVWKKRASWACCALALGLFLFTVLPVGAWLLTPIENAVPTALPDRIDGIILLAGDEDVALTKARGQPSVLVAGPRYFEFSRLARLHPEAKLAFIGGTARIPPLEGISNGDVARGLFADMGFDPSRILYEEKSRNTFENATEAMRLFHPSPQENWVLITSAFHMPRALLVFRKAGWTVYPDTVGYRTEGDYTLRPAFSFLGNLIRTTVALHEYVGLVAYWLMGRIDTPWPR